MNLTSIPRNPMPSGAVAGSFRGHDGIALRYARWPAAVPDRNGTVCLFQGRSEYIEKYFETVSDLRRRGFAVATMDWRGQGGSERPLKNRAKGHVEDFSDFDRDLAIFMQEIVLPDCPPPYFAMAHSMGGHILLRAAPKKDCWFDRMVLLAPMIGIANLPGSLGFVGAVSEVATYLGLGDFFIPGGSSLPLETTAGPDNVLTSDPLRLARNKAILEANPDLGLGSPTFAWIRAATASIKHITDSSFPASVHVPVLILAAANEKVVSNVAIERCAVQLKAGTQLIVRGASHEILQERDAVREQAWAAFDAYIPGNGDTT